MGTWENAPFENDAAADWFGDLMDETGLRERWLKGIQTDVEDDPQVARAAVWLFIQLGRVYVWPIDHFDHDLELSIKVADRLRKNEELLELEGVEPLLQGEYEALLERWAPDARAT